MPMRGLLLPGFALAVAAERAVSAVRRVFGAPTLGTRCASGARVAFAESGADRIVGRVSPWNTATRRRPLDLLKRDLASHGLRTTGA